MRRLGLAKAQTSYFSLLKIIEYTHLSPEDIEILDAVIQRFGKLPTDKIVDTMHKEDAYTKTPPHDIIQFNYAKTLSLASQKTKGRCSISANNAEGATLFLIKFLTYSAI